MLIFVFSDINSSCGVQVTCDQIDQIIFASTEENAITFRIVGTGAARFWIWHQDQQCVQPHIWIQQYKVSYEFCLNAEIILGSNEKFLAHYRRKQNLKKYFYHSTYPPLTLIRLLQRTWNYSRPFKKKMLSCCTNQASTVSF